MPETHTVGSYINAELEALIVTGLRRVALDIQHTTVDQRVLASDYADALQNDTFLLETTEVPDSVERREPTESDRQTLAFVCRALQMAEVEYHDDPKVRMLGDRSWIEFTTFPEGTYTVRVEPKSTIVHEVAEKLGVSVIDVPLLDRPICETPVPAETIVTPPITPTTADPGHKVDWPADTPPIGTMFSDDWPDAPLPPELPPLTIPTPDDPRYTELFNRMLDILQAVACARETENDILANEAEKRAIALLAELQGLTIEDWRTAVINDETLVGYLEWRASKIEERCRGR